ncbi:MAG: FAD-dependent oxidoreductase, partial [Halanaerobiales bacterium]
MSKKVLIVGGVAGGASAAARLRRRDEDTEIIILEKGDYISFANCGLPYHIGEVIEERDRLLVQTPESMEARFDLEVRTGNEVVTIDRKKKEVEVFDHDNENSYRESYDYLILSPGAEPIIPPLPGLEENNVFALRNIPDMDKINDYIEKNKPQSAVVVGGGFIGLEMVENLQNRGIDVSLVEMMDQVMTSMDPEIAAFIHNHMRAQNVNLYLGTGLKKVEHTQGKSRVVLQNGNTIETEIIFLGLGVSPMTELAQKADLELGPTGAIKVNDYLQTSDENIYAIGDAIEVNHIVTGEKVHIPLAGPANKQGRIAADNICGDGKEYEGTQGTAIAKVFDLAVASTGAAEKSLREKDIDYKVSYTNSNNHAGYYPGAASMFIKLLFTPDEGQVLGAQIVGRKGVDKQIDMLAAAVRKEMNIYDLQEMEMAYAPPFGSAKSPVNMAGFTAENIVRNLVDTVHWHEINELDANTVLLDVREKVETRLGRIEGSVNIPLNQLRDRTGELDRDKEIVVYCAVGLRGYIAARILKQKGFKHIKNLSGGYKLYSAVQDDKKEVREDPEHDELTSASNPEEGQKIGRQIATEEGRTVEIDASGLQCPGPIMQVYKKMEEMEQGDMLRVTATDPGFRSDIDSWCSNTGNTLLNLEEKNDKIQALIEKGTHQEIQDKNTGPKQKTPQTKKQGKTMVVFSGELDKAIASFIIANGAASMGNDVTLFFTFWGLNILRKDDPGNTNKNMVEKMFGKMMPRGSKKLPLSRMNMMGAGSKMIRRVMEDKGVDSLEELIRKARDNGVRLVACQMTMDIMGIKKEELIAGVEVGGVAS